MKYGHFDDHRREYVITRPDTPLPWINYLGCEAYFGLISNTAGGYSLYRDARLRRITRYRYNNVPSDVGGRYIYVRDDGTGEFWSPSWQPTRHEAEGYARDLHCMGLPPAGGAARREMLAMRRKPGPVRSIADQVDEAVFEGDDMDEVVAREAARARADGFRYLYFSYPSFGLGPPDANFGREGVQDVFISLYPEEDLKQVQRWTV